MKAAFLLVNLRSQPVTDSYRLYVLIERLKQGFIEGRTIHAQPDPPCTKSFHSTAKAYCT